MLPVQVVFMPSICKLQVECERGGHEELLSNVVYEEIHQAAA